MRNIKGKEWNGKGFPDEGVECKANILSDTDFSQWEEGISGGMIMMPSGRYGCILKTLKGAYLVGAQSQFRPIQTEEDKLIEAIEVAIKEDAPSNIKDIVLSAVLRAIKSGDIKL